MHEEELTGGNTGRVVRIDGTVRRETGPWTPAVHELLRAWEAAGIAETPRVIGVDEQGREILSFLEGEVLAGATPEVLWSRAVLEQAGRLLRRMHDASAPLADAGLEWRLPAHPPIEVVCHNDVAPYNLLVRDGALVGVIDADMASPGPRLWDLAYLVYRLAPFAEDAPAFDPAAFGTPESRMRALVAAYGTEHDDEVLWMMVQRLEALADYSAARADATGHEDLRAHAAMYRRDAARIEAALGS